MVYVSKFVEDIVKVSDHLMLALSSDFEKTLLYNYDIYYIKYTKAGSSNHILGADMHGSTNNNKHSWKALVTGWNIGIWKVFHALWLGVLSLKYD